MNKNIPTDLRATIISFNSFIGNIGLAIFAPMIGVLMDYMNIFSAQLICGIVMLVVLVIIELTFKISRTAAE